MARRKFSEERILSILKESDSKPVAQVCRTHGITGVTFYRWKSKYEKLQIQEVKKLRELEEENRKLKRIVADLNLDLHALKEVIRKKL